MSINDRYAVELRENSPIDYAGVTLYPLTMRDFALYQNARPAMELMLSSLPPRIARLSWFSALKALDDEAATQGMNTDFMGSVLRLLAAAMRLETLQDGKGRTVYPMRVMYTQDGKPSGVQAGAMWEVFIPAQQMGEIRQILAAQNGYEVPDENWNTELVAAQRYTENLKKTGQSLVFNLEALVYSVAVGAHVRAKDVWGWPIREFKQTEAAIDRQLNYIVYSLTEAGGHVKFKGGNPCPSWKLNRQAELPGDFRDINELDAGANGLLDEKPSI